VFWPLAGVNHRLGKVAGKTGGLDFIGDFEGKACASFTPGSGIPGIVPVQKQGRGKRLQECGKVYRRRRLAHTPFETGDCNYHARSLCISVLMEMQAYKNTKIRRARQG
jgi:hypothetical protein